MTSCCKTKTTNNDEDRDCASLARNALFPKRMHRDAADGSHFPALLQLDLLRDTFLTKKANATGSYLGAPSISSVFPRHVVVVRNLADGGTQWNGEPDFENAANTAFQVVPDALSVQCTSNCSQLFPDAAKTQRAFRRPVAAGTSTSGDAQEAAQEIILCTDRILKADSRDAQYKGFAKELPPKSFQAVEEVLAHQLVQVRHEQECVKPTTVETASRVEVEAAKAAECYFSRHAYDEKMQIKKGSRLQTGYSYLPGFVQHWSMSKCLSAVAKEHLVQQSNPEWSKQDISKAVAAALKEQ